MDKALQKVTQFIDEYAGQILRGPFECIQRMPGGNRILRHIAHASDREQLEDHLAEVRYALVFAGLGFQVEVEPLGGKGPDLKASRDGHHALVEITRFRKIYPGPPVLDLSDENLVLPDYGNPPRDIRKAFAKIMAKFPQLGAEPSVVAIWNDDEDLEELEVQTAVLDLRRDAERGALALPAGLVFVLYGSKWVRAGDHKQLHCFPVRPPNQPHWFVWQHELDTSTVGELVERALAQPVRTSK